MGTNVPSIFTPEALDLEIGTDVEAWDADLDAVAALDATAGLIAKTGANAYARRTITAGSANLTVSQGDGGAGNPTVDLAAAPTISVANVSDTKAGIDSDATTHAGSTANPHSTSIANIGSGTVAQLNAALSDGPIGGGAPSWVADFTTDEGDSVAFPPDSMTWLNSGVISSASMTSGVLTVNHDATSTATGAASPTGPVLYRKVDQDPNYPLVVLLRMAGQNIDANFEASGIYLSSDSDTPAANKILGHAQNNVASWVWYVESANGTTGSITKTAALWLRATLSPTRGEVLIEGNTSTATSPPTTGWVTLKRSAALTGWNDASRLRAGLFGHTGNTDGNFSPTYSYFSITGGNVV